MQFWSFASGSSGNCYLVESEGTRLLVECGRPFAQVIDYLEQHAVDPARLDGILLTHAHGDHCRSARYIAQEFQVPIFASGGTLGAMRLCDTSLARPILANQPFIVGEIEVRPFAVPHDCREPLGFRFESASGRAGFTTDLGWVPATIVKQFRDLDLLVIEANYDPHLLETGSYPTFLKQRVASTRGHLSNAAAAEAIAACGDRAPSAVWLAHLSEHNNSPQHALNTVGRVLKRWGLGHVQLLTTRHRRPSLYWTSAAARERQLALF